MECQALEERTEESILVSLGLQLVMDALLVQELEEEDMLDDELEDQLLVEDVGELSMV